MLPGKTFTPRDFLDILRRRVWLIALPPVVALFGALVYSSTLPDRYQSDMLIAIVPQRVPDAFVRSTVTLRTEERLSAIETEVKSRTSLEQMIGEFDLYPEERRDRPMEDVVKIMREDIGIELERPRAGARGPEPVSMFHVRFTHTEPSTAAQVTQRLGSLFVDLNAHDRSALAEATDQFLETQLTVARKRLEAQERRLEAFRRQHGNELPTQMQSNMQMIQATQLQVQALIESAARDRDRKLMLERLYREAQAEPFVVEAQQVPAQGPATSGAPGVAAVGTAQQQLAAARSALAGLERRLTPEHPDVVRTRRLIAELEPKAAAEEAERAAGDSGPSDVVSSREEAARRERLRQMAAEVESLDRQLAFKETEERRLREVVAEYQRRIEAVPGLESEWTAVSRDYDTQQVAYDELLRKSEASRIALDLEQRQIGEQFRIVDPAGVPVNPVGSIRARVNGAGLALGLVFGLGFTALLEFRDASFRSETDVLEALALPVLMVMPRVCTSAEKRHRRRRHLAVACAAVVAAAGMGYAAWTLELWNSVL